MRTVIWNLTYDCCWNCAFCCVDAGCCHNVSDELSLEEKLRVADDLGNIDCRVDLSGGELMMPRLKSDHFKLIKRLSDRLSRDRVGLSCSGAYIDNRTANFLSRNVGDVEMTMDAIPGVSYGYRPVGYHETAGRSADLLRKHGIKVGLQTIVTAEHVHSHLLDDLYTWMCLHDINNWSILKFFKSGRGEDMDLEPKDSECRRIVSYIRAMERNDSRTRKPEIDFHYLMPGSDKKGAGECRCVRKSVGILPNGIVTACFWGLKCAGKLQDRFFLGDLRKQSLSEILAGERAMYWENRCGGCAIGDDVKEAI
jgi:MoaA/NifB/PqqE/SkfB family radical SAM enzyme